MTKQDYIAIAKIFRDNPRQSDMYYARRLAEYMQEDNPRFSYIGFLIACGFRTTE